jgi:predicted nucleotidyltransferase
MAHKLFNKDQLAEICKKYGVRELSVFGSQSRGESRPDSDVDILVSFKEGTVLGFKIFSLEEELSKALGRKKVDLINKKFLNSRIRDQILREASLEYDEE